MMYFAYTPVETTRRLPLSPIQTAGEKRHAAFVEMGRFISECKKCRLLDIEIKHYRRRITVARIAFLYGPFDDGIYGVTTVRYGISTLNPDDEYNRVVGEYLALKKAFNEKIHPAVYNFVHGPCELPVSQARNQGGRDK